LKWVETVETGRRRRRRRTRRRRRRRRRFVVPRPGYDLVAPGNNF
jgi:hypothetical protein